MTFEDHLGRVAGTSSTAHLGDPFERRQKISTYYWNNASDLHAGALLAWKATQPEFPVTANDLGLGEGFSLTAALPPVFQLLAGLSMRSTIADQRAVANV